MHRLVRRGGTTLCALLSTATTSVGVASGLRGRFASSARGDPPPRRAALAFVPPPTSPPPRVASLPPRATKGRETSSGGGSKRRSSSSSAVAKKAAAKKSAAKRAATTEKKGEMSSKRAKKSGGGAAKAKASSDAPPIPHAPASLVSADDFDVRRSRILTPSVAAPREKGSVDNPCVIYWSMRDVRAVDNWALLFARSLAVRCEVPLRVVYCLPPPPDSEPEEGPDGAPPDPAEMSLTDRHGSFLLGGLEVMATELSAKKVPLDVLLPPSRASVGRAVRDHACSSPTRDALAVVCDLSPIRACRDWTERQAAPLLEAEGVPLYQVDAHNVVPVWSASPKREVGARTLRPKIHKVFGEYCTTFPAFEGNAHLEGEDVPGASDEHDWDRYESYLRLDDSIKRVEGVTAGHEAAMARFRDFCASKQYGLKNFDSLRNDPNYASVCTNLSPWINFGQVSFQRLALEVRALKRHPNGTAAYIEEGVVRRELSDNFVYYCPDGYDNLGGAAGWARDSLELHASDEREHLYDWEELERAETHDDLWNAAQIQVMCEGKMHGFLRMYWAKKILEWTVSPAYALRTAQYFNDRYAYDGNDPNGYVGVGWSIMGIHDMGWKERPIFGKIRYMNYAGCKRKFKVDQFVARYKGATENAAKASAGGAKKLSGSKRKA
ncbi:hypothetical protein ACHAWF_006192 [Thalassiosira exigua]